ncbi:hypothetical protein [Lysobacter sp. Hz 25]|uniref:hypothetical protein n=1 Tax=Lysobacter sp. Hz 25 TaxID=3383698 RepID=UPI0038D39E38
MPGPAANLIPPDVADLPALPPRFYWALPAPKRRRHSMPEPRHVVVDEGLGPAVASVVPGYHHARALIGLHRPVHADQHRREFEGENARETALRFVVRWVELRAATILAEYAERHYR